MVIYFHRALNSFYFHFIIPFIYITKWRKKQWLLFKFSAQFIEIIVSRGKCSQWSWYLDLATPTATIVAGFLVWIDYSNCRLSQTLLVVSHLKITNIYFLKSSTWSLPSPAIALMTGHRFYCIGHLCPTLMLWSELWKLFLIYVNIIFLCLIRYRCRLCFGYLFL